MNCWGNGKVTLNGENKYNYDLLAPGNLFYSVPFYSRVLRSYLPIAAVQDIARSFRSRDSHIELAGGVVGGAIFSLSEQYNLIEGHD